ncbi:MAG: hypothetical protein ACI4VW_08665, partial [Acutalibacteraceae bacterium]
PPHTANPHTAKPHTHAHDLQLVFVYTSPLDYVNGLYAHEHRQYFYIIKKATIKKPPINNPNYTS